MPVSRSSRRGSSQRGSSLIEGSFTLLTMLLLILGTLDMGQLLMHLHYLNERARASAHWASTHANPDDLTPVKNFAAYNSAEVPRQDAGMFGLTPSDVAVSYIPPGATDGVPRISVSISKKVQFLSPYLYGTYTPRSAVSTVPLEDTRASGF